MTSSNAAARHSENLDGRVVGLEKDVAGLKDSVVLLGGDMRRGFENISLDLKAKSTTNWQPIGMAVAAILTVSGWGFSYIGGFQNRLESQVQKIEAAAGHFSTKDEVKERFLGAQLRRDDAQRMTDARIERVEKDVSAIQSTMVPRGEHSEVWSSQRQRDENLQRQIDAAKKELTDLNTPRDTLQGILRRLEDVERNNLKAK